MRIIGGLYRHRLISWPDDATHIRPTKDRIREAIFNALGNIDGTEVLDLYSGSGAMGIEAISRGSYFATFVDINSISLKTTKDNINSLKIPSNQYQILGISDFAALDRFTKEDRSFDIVFLDPPYKEGKYQEVISLLINNNILREHGIIVCEANRLLDLDDSIFIKRKDYKYGEIHVSILWR